jgi:large subunit ribosomal protein L22
MTKKEHIASVNATNLDVSRKHAVEIGNFIRGRTLDKAKILMGEVMIKKTAVPFKIFNMDVGHKKGKIAAGRYPVKAATRILGLLNSAESNAEDKGLDVDALYVTEFIANKGTGSVHHGRKRGREMKRTHLKIVLEEKAVKKKVEKPKEAKKK